MIDEYGYELEEALARGRRARLVDYGIGATIISILFAIAMIIVPMIPVALRQPPVTIDGIVVHTPMPVCPGDTVEFTSHVIINEPSIIGFWTGILDVDKNDIVSGTRTEGIPVVRNEEGEVYEDVNFVVPQLDSGDYIRIAAFAAVNSDTEPSFAMVEFTVDENCPPYEEEN